MSGAGIGVQTKSLHYISPAGVDYRVKSGAAGLQDGKTLKFK
jgi:hypothetical protein